VVSRIMASRTGTSFSQVSSGIVLSREARDADGDSFSWSDVLMGNAEYRSNKDSTSAAA